eukprot:6369706-Karenia_brevis.AAC.1
MSRQLGCLPKSPEAHHRHGFAAHMKEMASHFEKVLNVERTINWNVISDVLDMIVPPANLSWDPPDYQRVLGAIFKLKKRKAPGPDGVPAELYQVSGVAEELARILCPHVRDWWCGCFQHRPSAWKDSHMVALYKGKGDLANLDNWRGVCLLQLLSKVVAILVNDSLRNLAEHVLDEAQ